MNLWALGTLHMWHCQPVAVEYSIAEQIEHLTALFVLSQKAEDEPTFPMRRIQTYLKYYSIALLQAAAAR